MSTPWFSLDPKTLAKTGVIGRANPLAGPDHFRRFIWYRPDPSMRPRQCLDFETLTNFPLEICPTVCLAGSLPSKIILKSPRSTASCLNVKQFFVPCHGTFQGCHFCSSEPPSMAFPNSPSCERFKDFISPSILERVSNGSLLVWERWVKFTRRIWSCPLQWSPVNHGCVMTKDFLIAGSRTVLLR